MVVRTISSLLQWHNLSVIGAFKNLFGAVRPENGNVMDSASSFVSTASPLTRETPRPSLSGTVPLFGSDGTEGSREAVPAYADMI